MGRDAASTDRHSISTPAPDLEARVALAGMVTRLMDHWRLPVADQAELLGLSGRGARQSIGRYRNGAPLGTSRDLQDRVGHLLAIHKSLRILFPHNRELAYRWMTQPNRHFSGLTPVEAVKQNGFLGLISIRRYLDFERGR